jgi:hypothetical protein
MNRFRRTAATRASAPSRLRTRLSSDNSGPADDGFVLLESIIAIALITVIMTGITMFFTTVVKSTSHERLRQVAVRTVDSTVEQVRGLLPSTILKGRDQQSVQTQYTAGTATASPTILRSALLTMTTTSAWDATATASGGQTQCSSTVTAACAAVPTSPVKSVSGTSSVYTSYYAGYCFVNADGSDNNCVSTKPTSYIRYLRVVVSVSWSDNTCASNSSGCTYVTSTLINADPDPKFNIQQKPTPAAQISPIAARSDAAGDRISATAPIIVANTGVPLFTWSASNLPAGTLADPIKMWSDGTITGTLANSDVNTGNGKTVTVVVTDAFNRTTTTTFQWKIGPALTAQGPGNLSTTLNSTYSYTMTATGGSTTGYKWADPTGSMPPGITLTSAGVLGGTLTTAGSYQVSLQVTDSKGRTAQTQFSWTVPYPTLTAAQANQSTVANSTVSLQLAASGGSGQYAWSDPNGTLTSVGLSMTAGGKVTGTLTAAGSYSISVLVNDSKAGMQVTVPFTWTVQVPSVGSPGNKSGTAGTSVNWSIAYSCPTATCTYGLSGTLPSTLSTSAGVITGSLPTSFVGNSATYSGSVVITDLKSNTASSAPFTITVYAAPTITSAADQAALASKAVTLPVAATCPNGGCTYSLAFSKTSGTGTWTTTPSISATGVITGKTPSSNGVWSFTVTVTDGANTTTSDNFVWTVGALALAIPDQTTKRPTGSAVTTVTIDPRTWATPSGAAYTVTSVTSLPSWLKQNADGTLTATITSSTATASSIAVTIASSSSSTSVASDTFKWTIS